MKKINLNILKCILFLLIGFSLDVSFVFAQNQASFSQTNWSGGVGDSLENQFQSASQLNVSNEGEISIAPKEGWFDQNWLYRKSILIDYQAGTEDVNDYQFFIENFDTTALITDGKLKADCSDIRFVNSNGDELNHVLISDSCNTNNTRFWVQVDALNFGEVNQIYLYYGNDQANSNSSWEDTFSYDQPEWIGLVGDPTIARSGLNIISLANDNQVQIDDGGINALNDQAQLAIASDQINVGSKVKASRLIYADGNGDGVDMVTPISFAGTEFIHHANRYTHVYTLYSVWGDANYEVYFDGVEVQRGTIVNNNSATISRAGNFTSVRIVVTNNVPIYVHHYGNNNGTRNDSLVLYPVTSRDLFGVPSNQLNAAAGLNNLALNWIQSNGVEGNTVVNANQTYGLNTQLSQGTAGGFRVTGNRPFALTQLADSDGGETTSFWPAKEMGPVIGANGIAQYVTMATAFSNVNCQAYDPAGAQLGNVETSGNHPLINSLYFGNANPNNHGWVNAGWKIVCDKPIYAYYEKDSNDANEPNDEHNLWSYPQMRKFIYPTPVIDSIGNEEFQLNSSGNLTSNIFNTESNQVSWDNLIFNGIELAGIQVKLRSGNQADLSDALDFENCAALNRGADIIANSNCVNHDNQYLQYFVQLNIQGQTTPIFHDLEINYETPEPEPEPQPEPDAQPEPEPNPQPEPNPNPQPGDDSNDNDNSNGGEVPDPDGNISEEPETFSVFAGEDLTIVSGNPVLLSSMVSGGSNLTYEWNIVEGEGYLLNEEGSSATYFVGSDHVSQSVRISLTVTDQNNNQKSDDLLVYVISHQDVAMEISPGIIVANQQDEILFQVDELEISNDNRAFYLPEGSENFNIHLTPDQFLIIGLPDYLEKTGRIYLSKNTYENLPEENFLSDGLINLDDFYVIDGFQTQDQFGSYINSQDLNFDGESEILVSSPFSGKSGAITVFDLDANPIDLILGNDLFDVDSILSHYDEESEETLLVIGSDMRSINGDLQFFEDYSSTGVNEITVFRDENFSEYIKILSGEDELILSVALGRLNSSSARDLALITDQGRIYIFYDISHEESDLSLNDASFILTPPADSIEFGISMQIGDVNGDGLDDFIIGDPEAGEDNQGAIHILFGKSGIFQSTSLDQNPQLLTLYGAKGNDKIGTDIILTYNEGTGFYDIRSINQNNEMISFRLPNLINPENVSSSDNELPSSSNSFSSGGGGCSLSASQSSNGVLILFALTLLLFFKLSNQVRRYYR